MASLLTHPMSVSELCDIGILVAAAMATAPPTLSPAVRACRAHPDPCHVTSTSLAAIDQVKQLEVLTVTPCGIWYVAFFLVSGVARRTYMLIPTPTPLLSMLTTSPRWQLWQQQQQPDYHDSSGSSGDCDTMTAAERDAMACQRRQ